MVSVELYHCGCLDFCIRDLVPPCSVAEAMAQAPKAMLTRGRLFGVWGLYAKTTQQTTNQSTLHRQAPEKLS